MTRTLLATGTLLPPEMDALEREFDIIRLWKETDPEAVLQARRLEVVALLSAYNAMPVTHRILEALPNLEIIAQFGAGVDNIDLETARARGIFVTNTPDVLTDDTADIALSLLLSVSRRIVEADMFVRVGKWLEGAFPLATSPKGKRVGIVGMGRIGQAIAKRCVAFGMEVLWHGPRAKPEIPYTYMDDLTRMAEASDYLVLACAGGEATRHLVDAGVLAALGPRGFLINVARGSVVDQAALIAALKAGGIAGAGLDVYQNEPHVPEDLKTMDNVVLLPHIGSATVETRTVMGRMVIENLHAHFAGRPLISPVR